jgi:uncharacterized protein (TIGR02611 family)
MHDESDTTELSSAAPPPAAPVSPAEQARRHQRAAKAARKIAITVLGVAVLAAGLAMMVLPGPGLIVIVLGLFILSLEFEWAAKRLDQARDKALDAAHKTAASRTQTGFALFSGLVLIGAGVFLGVNKSVPLHGWFTGGTLIVSGLAAMGTVIWSVRDLRRRRAAG